jgi:hypothetical protein
MLPCETTERDKNSRSRSGRFLCCFVMLSAADRKIGRAVANCRLELIHD